MLVLESLPKHVLGLSPGKSPTSIAFAPFISFMASGHHMITSEGQPQNAGRHSQEENNLVRGVDCKMREIVKKATASLFVLPDRDVSF
jgi:hypothetical protein